MIRAVVFDMDGLLIDSEEGWGGVRERLVRERGGGWHDRAQQDMMGMSSLEWSRYMHDELGLAGTPEEINVEVVRRMEIAYGERLPPVAPAGGGAPTGPTSSAAPGGPRRSTSKSSGGWRSPTGSGFRSCPARRPPSSASP